MYAGFVSFNSEFEGFSYMVGLRGEYMDRFLDQKTLSETYSFEQMDYFPSINISRKIDDHQLQLGYSKRINRPNDNMLNPFAFYSDPNITISGNPALKPEYIDALELNYQKCTAVFLFLFNHITENLKILSARLLQLIVLEN